MMRMRRGKGFTLLELIIVVIIIGILATLALGQYIKVTKKARAAEGKHILGILRASQIRYAAEHDDAYSADVALLDADVTPPQYHTYSVSADAGTLASVVSTKDGYTLTMALDGTISCTPAADAKCTDIGYP